MPQMRGRKAADRHCILHPALKVLFVYTRVSG